VSEDNAKAIIGADIIVLAILPQQLNEVINQISGKIDPENQLIVSVVSGVTCQNIKDQLGADVQVVRAMPNTAISIGQSMTCVAGDEANAESIKEVASLFETVGSVIKINEELMTAATALCACGIAFFLRSIRARSEERRVGKEWRSWYVSCQHKKSK